MFSTNTSSIFPRQLELTPKIFDLPWARGFRPELIIGMAKCVKMLWSLLSNMMMKSVVVNVEKQERFVEGFMNEKKEKTRQKTSQMKNQTQIFFVLQQQMNCVFTKTLSYDDTCHKLLLGYNRSMCNGFLSKSETADDLNDNENAEENEKKLMLYSWQMSDVIWVEKLKVCVISDGLIANDMSLRKTVTSLVFIVLMIKLRARKDFKEFHRLTLIAISSTAMRVWKIEIQQYFPKLTMRYFMSFFEKSLIEKKDRILNISCDDLKDFVKSPNENDSATAICLSWPLTPTHASSPRHSRLLQSHKQDKAWTISSKVETLKTSATTACHQSDWAFCPNK